MSRGVKRAVRPDGSDPLVASLREVRYTPDPGRPFRLRIDRLDLEGPGVVLLGRSGSGKTTLLEILLGLRTPDSGEVILLGSPVSSFETFPWGRVGYLPQFPERLLFATSVAEEVAFGARAGGTDRPGIPARVDESLRAVGLSPEEDRERSPHRLSFGQRRRVALASILSSSPGLLVLDEPSAGLDLPGYRVLRDLLLSRRAESLPFVLATHDLALAGEVGTQFVRLDRGSVSAERSRGPSSPASERKLGAAGRGESP
jgi:energy-coupling factor transporter ATP-binding protein EcfA2